MSDMSKRLKGTSISEFLHVEPSNLVFDKIRWITRYLMIVLFGYEPDDERAIVYGTLFK
jgi:hypothetical protein